MKMAVIVAAIAFALGGLAPMAVLVAIMATVHVLRSPDRLLDASYAAAFCTLGYLFGG